MCRIDVVLSDSVPLIHEACFRFNETTSRSPILHLLVSNFWWNAIYEDCLAKITVAEGEAFREKIPIWEGMISHVEACYDRIPFLCLYPGCTVSPSPFFDELFCVILVFQVLWTLCQPPSLRNPNSTFPSSLAIPNPPSLPSPPFLRKKERLYQPFLDQGSTRYSEVSLTCLIQEKKRKGGFWFSLVAMRSTVC